MNQKAAVDLGSASFAQTRVDRKEYLDTLGMIVEVVAFAAWVVVTAASAVAVPDASAVVAFVALGSVVIVASAVSFVNSRDPVQCSGVLLEDSSHQHASAMIG